MNLREIPARYPQETSKQYVYRVLFSEIMTLRLAPGTVLLDSEISKELGISRTPVREAFISLQEARLVDIFPKRSSCVSKINLNYVEEGLFVRYQIEKAVIREAMNILDGSALLRISRNLEDQSRCLADGNASRFWELDNRFHRDIYVASNKPWTWETITRITTHHDRIRRLMLQSNSTTQPIQKLYEEHCALFDAVVSRNHGGVDDLIYCHLAGGYRMTLPSLLKEYPDYFDI